MSELFDAAVELRQRGEAFVVATVVRAESPTSGKPGDKALITADGVVTGWVGGSCAQPVVEREARAALADGECRLLRLSPDVKVPRNRPGLTLRPMTCYSGGTMEIHIEPYLVQPHLLVFGNSPAAQALLSLGGVMGYRVTAVDLTDRPRLEGETEIVRDLAEIPATTAESTVAVVATHGVFDEEALEWLLERGASYVGLVTSKRRLEAIRAALVERGVDRAALECIHAPAGLDIGARRPEEIALSILAQVVEVRRANTARQPPSETAKPEAARSSEHGSCCHGGGDDEVEQTR